MPPHGLVIAVWLFLLVFPLLFLLVWVNRWLDAEEQWRELTARREMLDVMRELQPGLAPAKRLEEGLSRIEARMGFPAARRIRSWKAAPDAPGLDAETFSRTFRSECRRVIGCEPAFLLTAGADGRSPNLFLDTSLREGAPPKASTMQPVWLSISGWLERKNWREDEEIRSLRSRWNGSSTDGKLQTRSTGLCNRFFGDDPFTRVAWGIAQPFMRMRPGGELFLAYANFLTAEPKPDSPLLGGYVAVFRISDLSKRFLLDPLLSRPDGGISRRFVVLPRESRTKTHLVLEYGAPQELLQRWCAGFKVRPFSLMLWRTRESLEHPFRAWQPWLRGSFFLFLAGSGLFLLLKLGGFSLPMKIRGQIAFAVAIATVLPLIACGGVMISYLEFQKEIDRDRQGKIIAERLEMLENGFTGYLEAMKQRLWRMKQLIGARLTVAPEQVLPMLDEIRRRAASPVVLLITDAGNEYLVADPGISRKSRSLADRLGEMARTVSLRVFLAGGCFKETEIDTPPRSTLWTRRRRAMAANISMIDITTLLRFDGRELDPKFSGIDDSILFQYMVKSTRTGRLQALFYVMYRRSDLVKMYFETLERRNEPFSETRSDMTMDFALFSTLGGGRKQLDPSGLWPRGASADLHVLGLARRALMIPEATMQELPEINKGISFVRSFSEFGAVAIGCARPVTPAWQIWKERFILTGWALYAFLITVLVTVFLSRNFAMPLDRISAAGSEVAAGRFDVALRLDTGDEFERLAAEFNAMTAGLRERERLARFVSAEVLETVRTNVSSGLHPGGERRQVGILFAHIVDFERLTVHDTVDGVFSLLDEILPRMEQALRANGGSLDKVIGDGVMGVFHPSDVPAAIRACAAALAIKNLIAGMNAARLRNNLEPLHVSVGVVKGYAICGRIGSRKGRLDFTIIGDAVNLAARLEAESRRRPEAPILLDEETALEAQTSFDCIKLDIISVKGRLKPVRVYTLGSLGVVA